MQSDLGTRERAWAREPVCGTPRPRTHLLDVVVLAQQGVGAVGDAHGHDAHGADHDHGHVDIGEHGHHGGAHGEAQRPQHVDDPDAQVVVVQVLLEQSCRESRCSRPRPQPASLHPLPTAAPTPCPGLQPSVQALQSAPSRRSLGLCPPAQPVQRPPALCPVLPGNSSGCGFAHGHPLAPLPDQQLDVTPPEASWTPS